MELTQRELDLARFVAIQRDSSGSKAKANAEKFGHTGETFVTHVRGCLGELATAKGLNLYWTGAGTTYHTDADVGVAQVRMTAHATGRLLIRPDDAKLATIDAPWVLVIQHDLYRYTLAGWIIGREGLHAKYLASPAGREPAYFIPQDVLRSFDEAGWLT